MKHGEKTVKAEKKIALYCAMNNQECHKIRQIGRSYGYTAQDLFDLLLAKAEKHIVVREDWLGRTVYTYFDDDDFETKIEYRSQGEDYVIYTHEDMKAEAKEGLLRRLYDEPESYMTRWLVPDVEEDDIALAYKEMSDEELNDWLIEQLSEQGFLEAYVKRVLETEGIDNYIYPDYLREEVPPSYNWYYIYDVFLR